MLSRWSSLIQQKTPSNKKKAVHSFSRLAFCQVTKLDGLTSEPNTRLVVLVWRRQREDLCLPGRVAKLQQLLFTHIGLNLSPRLMPSVPLCQLGSIKIHKVQQPFHLLVCFSSPTLSSDSASIRLKLSSFMTIASCSLPLAFQAVPSNDRFWCLCWLQCRYTPLE